MIEIVERWPFVLVHLTKETRVKTEGSSRDYCIACLLTKVEWGVGIEIELSDHMGQASDPFWFEWSGRSRLTTVLLFSWVGIEEAWGRFAFFFIVDFLIVFFFFVLLTLLLFFFILAAFVIAKNIKQVFLIWSSTIDRRLPKCHLIGEGLVLECLANFIDSIKTEAVA